MSTIITLRASQGYDAIQFVKDYRKKGLFRKERTSYTPDVTKAMPVNDIVLAGKIEERVKKDYPFASVIRMTEESFYKCYGKDHIFWAIARRDRNGDAMDFYTGMNDKNGVPLFSTDIRRASLHLDDRCAADTVGAFRNIDKGSVIGLEKVYCNLVNQLSTQRFMIVCMKRGGERARFFVRRDDKTLVTADWSDEAAKYLYSEVVKVYDDVKANCKGYAYAVLPAFNDNVNCRNIEGYVKANKIPTSLRMTFRLEGLVKKN